MRYDEAKEKYKLACHAYNPGASGTAASQFIHLIPIFLKLVVEGDHRSLSCLGVCAWFSQTDRDQQYALHYLKASIMFNNDPRAWLELAIIHIGSRLWDGSRAACELYAAWKYTNDNDVEIRNEINKRLPKIGSSLKSLAGVTINFNKLDYLWAVFPPFWVQFYKYHFKENVQNKLDELSGYALFKTKARLDACQSSCDDFEKKASVWLALSQHFKWLSRPLYLFYAKNCLNEKEEIPLLLKKAIDCCGYTVHLLEWETFDKQIPEEAVVGILSDMVLLSIDRDKYPAYKLVQKHSGTRLWIPWQLPVPSEEKLFSVYWESLPEDWRGSWIHLKGSLFDHPLFILLGSQGLLPHLFPQIQQDNFPLFMNYWQSRVVERKKFQSIYGDNPAQHFETLSIFWHSSDLNQEQKIEFLSQDQFKPGGVFFEYFISDDNNRPFYQSLLPVPIVIPEVASQAFPSKKTNNVEQILLEKVDSIDTQSVLHFSCLIATASFSFSIVLYVSSAIVALVCFLSAASMPMLSLIVMLSAATVLLFSALLASYFNREASLTNLALHCGCCKLWTSITMLGSDNQPQASPAYAN